jgi:hypothetical protein
MLQKFHEDLFVRPALFDAVTNNSLRTDLLNYLFLFWSLKRINMGPTSPAALAVSRRVVVSFLLSSAGINLMDLLGIPLLMVLLHS